MTTYTMEARENYSAALAADFAVNTFPQLALADGAAMGLSYDPERRKILYVAVIDATLTPVNNDTGFTIWDGVTSVANGVNITAGSTIVPLKTFTAEKDIDTGAVTFYPHYLAANTVPASIGGGGAWRRFTNDFFYTGGNMPNGVEPRTGDFWVSAGSCNLYLFRRADNFSLIISPLRPQLGDASNLVQLVGVTEDYVYARENNLAAAPLTFDQFYLTPTNITAAETTADELLVYGQFDYPVRSEGTDPSFYRSVIDTTGNMWVLSMFQTGPREYTLYKFTPPFSIPYPSPPVGGGFTDVTPWGASTGPNSISGYEQNDAFGGFNQDGAYKNIAMYNPATNDLFLISKFFPDDKAAGTQADFKFCCTYVDLDDMSFDFHSTFVGPYMTEAWSPTAVAADGAYMPIDCREVNPYLNTNDFTFPDTDYSRRCFFFIVQRLVAGVPTGSNACVIVWYRFVYGQAPEVISVTPEDGWDAAYTTYATAISDTNVIQASQQPTIDDGGLFCQFSNTQDSGIWDPDTQAFWWAGSNVNMYDLDATFTNRASAGTEQQPWPPFLRMTFSASPPPTLARARVGVTYTKVPR